MNHGTTGTHANNYHKYDSNGIPSKAAHKHTSTLDIPIIGTSSRDVTRDYSSRDLPSRDNASLAGEMERMNAKMRDLRKSFEDLTAAPPSSYHGYERDQSASASTSSRVANNFFEGPPRTGPAFTSTLPHRRTLGGGNSNKDDFEREVENFRRNFEEFRHSSSTSANATAVGAGPLTILPSNSGSLSLDADTKPSYVEASDGRKLYRVTLDMNDFTASDIKVKVVDGNLLRVSARADHVTPSGGNVQREFNREFTIPANVDVDSLVSRIDARGIMNLEAPVKLQSGNFMSIDRHDSPSSKFRSTATSSVNATANQFFSSPPSLKTNFINDDRRFAAPDHTESSSASSKFRNTAFGPFDTTPLKFGTAFDTDDRRPRRKYSWTGSLRNFPTGGSSVGGGAAFDRRRDDHHGFGGGVGPLMSKELGPTPATAVATTAATPFSYTFDLSEYEPDEIRVSVGDNLLKIHAKHEERSGNGSVSREFNREYTVPPTVNPDTIKSTLGRDGRLVIEAIPTGGSGSNGGAHGIGGGHNGTSEGVAVPPPTFKLKFDMAAYEPHEIKVKVAGGMVRIEARHEGTEGADRGRVLREFSREYVIPRGVDADQLRSSLSPSGTLTIEAATAIAPF